MAEKNILKFEDDYQTIKDHCLKKLNVVFYADKLNTPFKTSNAPIEWTKWSNGISSQDELEELRRKLLSNDRGLPQHYILLELQAYELGANVFYRYRGESHVSIKFVFDNG